MGYWDEVKDVVLKGINLAVEGVREGTETAVGRGMDSLTYAQLKKDLFFEQRTLHDLLADLGDAVHDLYRKKKDIYADEKVKGVMDRVIAAENKCRKIEKDLKELWPEKNEPEAGAKEEKKEEKSDKEQ